LAECSAPREYAVYIGLDVYKDAIAIVNAEPGRAEPV
jgi:hypothetical protein